MLLQLIQVTPPIWATKHYLWAVGGTRTDIISPLGANLGVQVATKALKYVCCTGGRGVPPQIIIEIKNSKLINAPQKKS